MSQEYCLRCGTPLMLVVASTAHRFEDLATPEPRKEHLLERISVLEYRVARVTKIAERAVETAQRAVEMADRQADMTDKICDLLGKLTTVVMTVQAEEEARAATTPKPKAVTTPKPKNVVRAATKRNVKSGKAVAESKRSASN